ncbi:uncharacterized protein LOC125648045 [Ostrea edulis]|uniref:uncharacterized protein LOC125648045 n=1 Tax=Ostrea edulis TaxID=37623 RepID=UPI002094E1DD|nr:uncharacterized protein LOC125648045 [Ostrea edulis]
MTPILSNVTLYKRPKSYAFFAMLCVWILVVKNLNGQQLYSSSASRNAADVTLCPFMLITPSIVDTDFGTTAVFTATVEAKLDPPLDLIWQFISTRNIAIQDINEHDAKYSSTESLPSLEFIINDADFDDVGEYQLQVRISGGWCTSRKVELRNVWGVLQYNERCNLSRECDERRKNLQCSNSKCLCQSSYYHQNQLCFLSTHTFFHNTFFSHY